MRTITVPSSAVALRSEKPLTPAMMAAVWEIAAALDEARTPAQVPNAVWLDIPTARLRGPEARQDNIWLRECLERLTGVKLSGEYRGDPWGAVVLAEWHITEGGSMAHLLIPPAGVHALRSPATFTKIEAHAAHRLTGHGRRLYAILADKKHLGRPSWKFSIEELRALMGVDGQKSYEVWGAFRRSVLDPAVEAINAYGTVSVKMTPEKLGRSVHWVRFDWRWKDLREAADMAAFTEARSLSSQDEPADAAPKAGKAGPKADATPPRSARPAPAKTPDPPPVKPHLAWWDRLTDEAREAWKDRVGRTFQAGEMRVPRKDADVAYDAFELHKQGEDTPQLGRAAHRPASA